MVGGGLAGLTAARHAVERGADVTVVESGPRLGGQVRSERINGCVLEHGAEGFIAKSNAIPTLCRSLGLQDELLSQATHRALVLRGGVLEELTEGSAGRFLGIQASNADWGHGLCTLRGGMGRLVDALEVALGSSDIIREVAVDGVEPSATSGVRVSLADGMVLEADGAILALPGEAMAGVLHQTKPHQAGRLREWRTVSSVSITLVMRRDAIRHPLDASGLICAGQAGPGLRACTFASSKFPGRAPHGWCVLRAFYRPEPGSLTMTDEAWLERCLSDLAPVLGISDEPALSRVCRWPSAIPRYSADHDRKVDDLTRDISTLPRVELAGAAVMRSGLDGAVRSGLESAERLLVRTLA